MEDLSVLDEIARIVSGEITSIEDGRDPQIFGTEVRLGPCTRGELLNHYNIT